MSEYQLKSENGESRMQAWWLWNNEGHGL